ncbi:MAG: T9SS type A sorting domain-containing protein [Arachidicoccus sp.]|nr:T9SS type A sorting domain-containing protein [Arachidicoccus sp.]
MKNLVIYLMLVIAGSFTASAANEKMIDYTVSVTKNEGEVVTIDFNKAENMQVSIMDYNGNILCNYTDIKNSRSFDFTNLPAGKYFIKVENDHYAETTLVSKNDTTINVKNNYKLVLKPIFKKEENKMQVYVPNPSNSHVEIDVYDKDNYLVYSYKDNQSVINKVFDFSKSPYGKYTININSANDDINYSTDFERK